jgi:hypothetical protein
VLCADSSEDRTFLFAAEGIHGYPHKISTSYTRASSSHRRSISTAASALPSTYKRAHPSPQAATRGCFPVAALERGFDEITRGFYKSNRIKLVIHKKFGKHVRRFQGNLASPFYGLSNIATTDSSLWRRACERVAVMTESPFARAAMKPVQRSRKDPSLP